MPRNNYKTRCQVPGCHAWAMRRHTHCRSHRDTELGPRGAGAPLGNLNALKHGRYSQLLPRAALKHLAHQIHAAPDDLPRHVGVIAQTIHEQFHDPLVILLILQRVLAQLAPLVAHHLCADELDALTQHLPPAVQATVRAIIDDRTSRLRPEEKLFLLRKIVPVQNN